MSSSRTRDRKRVREANGSGSGMGDENDVDFIDVEMDTFEEQDAGLGAGIGGGAGAGGGSFYRIPARAQQLQRTRMLTHVPFYPKLGAEDLEDATMGKTRGIFQVGGMSATDDNVSCGQLLLRVAAHTRVSGDEYTSAPVRQVRVPGVATVKRAVQQALQSTGSGGAGAVAVTVGAAISVGTGDLKAKLVLAPGMEPVSIIDGLPLDLQLDAAASSQKVDIHRLPRPPLLNVYVDAVTDAPTRKRARTSPQRAPAPHAVNNVNSVNGIGTHAAPAPPLATFAARAAARGRGARNPVARSRRRSHVQAAAAIAADAERSQRTRRKRASVSASAADAGGSEHVVQSSSGGGAGGKGNGGGANGRMVVESVVFEALSAPDPCADTYIVMSLIAPCRLSSRENTLFCALCGALATEQCAMVLPAAEEPLRQMLSDAAIVLAAFSLRTKRIPKPLFDLIANNGAFDSNQPDLSQAQPKSLSRFSAAAKRLVEHPFLVTSSQDKENKMITSNQMSSQNHSNHQPPITTHPGHHWNRSQTRNHLISLIQIIPEFIPTTQSINHPNNAAADAAVAN